MPFGKRRFTQLAYVFGAYHARFVPLAMDGADEFEDWETLKRAVEDNARERHPLPDAEEQIALRAFQAQARGKTFSRAAVESVAERGRQRAIVDVLDLPERAAIEKFRRCVERAKLPPKASGADPADPTIASRYEFLDACKAALALVDKYLPKGS